MLIFTISSLKTKQNIDTSDQIDVFGTKGKYTLMPTTFSGWAVNTKLLFENMSIVDTITLSGLLIHAGF